MRESDITRRTATPAESAVDQLTTISEALPYAVLSVTRELNDLGLEYRVLRNGWVIYAVDLLGPDVAVRPAREGAPRPLPHRLRGLGDQRGRLPLGAPDRRRLDGRYPGSTSPMCPRRARSGPRATWSSPSCDRGDPRGDVGGRRCLCRGWRQIAALGSVAASTAPGSARTSSTARRPWPSCGVKRLAGSASARPREDSGAVPTRVGGEPSPEGAAEASEPPPAPRPKRHGLGRVGGEVRHRPRRARGDGRGVDRPGGRGADLPGDDPPARSGRGSGAAWTGVDPQGRSPIASSPRRSPWPT